MENLAILKNRLIVTIQKIDDDASVESLESAIEEILQKAMLDAKLFSRLERLEDTPTYSWEEVKNKILAKDRQK